MSLVKFIANGAIVEAGISLEGHRVQLTFKDPISTITTLIALGFQELNEYNQRVMSNFTNHRYLYHEEVEGLVFITTDDPEDRWHEQPFVPPTPVPPEPHIPTLDEVKAEKISEMEDTMHQRIEYGVTVTLSDGTVGRFGLSALNQTSLTNLRLMAEQAEDKEMPSIPWHISDTSVPCQYFSPNDIMTIINAAIAMTTYEITFLRDLRIYINDLNTKEEVEAIVYDLSCLPREYWSEVLIDIVNRMNDTVSA